MPEIIEDREERRRVRQAQRALRRTLRSEIKYWRPVIINTATQFGLTHWLRKDAQPSWLESMITGRTVREKIRLMEIRAGREAIYFRIDPQRLPMFVSIADLKNEELLETLSASVQRDVEFFGEPTKGYWWIVNRDQAARQIPMLVPYSDVWGMVHKHDQQARKNGNHQKPPLYFVAGIGKNGRIISGDLESAPHILIAGTTGGGKSVTMNQIITTLTSRNTPEELRLYLFDFKGGVEFDLYRDSPHLEKLVDEPGDTEPVILGIFREIKRRQKLLKGRALKLSQYNRAQMLKDNPAPLPYLIIAVDELTEIMLAASINDNELLSDEFEGTGDKKFSKHSQTRVKNALIRILQQGRAFGVHCILSTQYPSTRTVDSHIKYNCPVKFALPCSSNPHSISIIDTGEAKGLEPEGRAIFVDHGRRNEVQVPFITLKQTRGVVEQLSKRSNQPIEQIRDFKEMLRFANEHLEGQLSWRILYEEFGPQGRELFTREEIRDYVANLEGETVEIDGESYRAIAGGGPKPRQLIKQDGA